MSAVFLKSVTVSNFRSIKGSITVPLDAPVVLVHGHNGAGKTSLLSAIELALTGQAMSLSGLDANYADHLLHKGVAEGHVKLQLCRDVDSKSLNGMSIRPTGILGAKLLTDEESRFYSERCYLAQATLARLLEIYERKDGHKSDSPLTRFVKDLLGLDKLDALINGLHDAGDVRRLRNSVPLYWEARGVISDLEKQVGAHASEVARLKDDLSQLDARLLVRLTSLLGPSITLPLSVERLADLESAPEEERLQGYAKLRRELTAIQEQWSAGQSKPDSDALRLAEQSLASATLSLNNWLAGAGNDFEKLLEHLGVYFPNLPQPKAIGQERARVSATQLLQADLDRCEAALASSEKDSNRLAEIEEALRRARARAVVIDTQIASGATRAGEVAQALASIAPHIHSEDCPVCGRDFAEVSSVPLNAHLSNKIASLVDSADRLRALTQERAEATKLISEVEREQAQLVARQLSPERRDELKTRKVRLEEFKLVLVALGNETVRGDHLLTATSAASRLLSSLRSRDQRAEALRSALQQFISEMELAPLGEAESLGAAADRCLRAALEKEEALVSLQRTRRDALTDVRERQALSDRLALAEEEAAAVGGRLDRIREAKAKSDEIIRQAKELSKVASLARSNVVRRVFNDSLNNIWRELFVRLAPEEPFVPAFAIPEANGATVEAVLETLHRSGEKGGNPRAMLSAGNLNTAALTLFLALHLSVRPLLPLLVIDDPVQSMDEVHISQFAALLRTLSKQHSRQVIIAVHEKPLFDYLALELSPAFQDDRLITIELGRTSTGSTVMEYNPIRWTPDAVAAE